MEKGGFWGKIEPIGGGAPPPPLLESATV